MKTTVSPKQAARAMEVSESSVKRWCDRGDIPAQLTPGGHRRIPIQGLLQFLEGSGRALIRPDLLGLKLASRPGPRATRRLAEQFREALLAANESQVNGVLIDAHLSGHSVSSIGDDIIAPVFREIGGLWECGAAEVFQERQACELASRALDQLRQLIPTCENPTATAIGGTAAGDHYALATTLCELVLRESNWEASSVGCNLPFETMAAAVQQRNPKLFWISASHIPDVEHFVTSVESLAQSFPQTTFVIGGRMVDASIVSRVPTVTVCPDMRRFEQFASERRNGS